MKQDRQADFSQRLTDILNHGALNLGLALGYQLKYLMRWRIWTAGHQPVSGTKTGLHERYVREWLGIMCTGRIIEIHMPDPSGIENGSEEPLYYLPLDHAALLTRKAGSGNMGCTPRKYLCSPRSPWPGWWTIFQTVQALNFPAYPRFQAFMSQLSHAKHRQVLIPHFLPEVDEGRLITRLEKGIFVCDLGCGQGIALQLMAQHFPASFLWALTLTAPPWTRPGKPRRNWD